jgi:hypothetical protein
MKLARAKAKLRTKGYHTFIVQASLVIVTMIVIICLEYRPMSNKNFRKKVNAALFFYFA